MTKHNEKGDTVTLAPMVPMTSDWFTSVNPKELWRALVPQLIKVEEFRDDDTMVVRAEMPGLDPDKDIDVTVQDGVLRLHAQRTEKSEQRDKAQYHSEFRYGSITRLVDVPRGIRSEDVEASYRDGILEVRLPAAAPDETSHKVAIAR